MGDENKSAHAGATGANQYCVAQGNLSLADYARKIKTATMKVLQKLTGASSLGFFLVEGTMPDVPGDPGEVYKARAVWNHKDRDKRTKCFRVMGAARGSRHEVWLILWSKGRRDIEMIEKIALAAPAWRRREGDVAGRIYGRGPVVLGFDPEESTLSLIYGEERGKPFTNKEYCVRLSGLFDELISLLAPA